MGVTAALFVLILASTGLLLNHTDRLRLAERHLHSDMLLDWYGIGAPDVVSYAAGRHWISVVAGRIYFDATPIPASDAPLIGAIASGDQFVAAFADHLLLLGEHGEIIESLDSLPTPILSLGKSAGGHVAVRSATDIVFADAALLEWRVGDDDAIEWSTAAAPPATLSAELKTSGRALALNLERVLLDLHSGRLFGRYGIYLMDAAALIMIGLALSGLWLWYRQGRKRRLHAAQAHTAHTSKR
jgi:hypothetical protein